MRHLYSKINRRGTRTEDFNSLDAQRESAEAYIWGQRGEQWIGLPHSYDDGGFTGSNVERPALRRLLADIELGAIDCVVVYKVDRLSRSLLDFARIMEVFDKRGVSFVSVTQPLNTNSPMGRLTLNMLLSFAQFERETRDKMRAARRRGKWTGGHPPLGCDCDSATAPVLILTSSNDPSDREKTAKLGVSRYVQKATEIADFLDIGRVVKIMLREISSNSPGDDHVESVGR